MTITEPSTDHQLKHAIERELNWACDVDSDRVGVTVSDGAVMLAGQVRSYPEKAAAVTAAMRVRGVTALADEIIVRGDFDQIDDADIARDAAIALSTTTLVPIGSVQAAVCNHRVTLTGTVHWHHQFAAAAHAVSVLPGVTAVDNLVVLAPGKPMIASADAAGNVTAALVRNAEIEALDVHVTVSGTEIRLAGHVRTWAARHQAEYAAWCTPGVTHVDNQVLITPDHR